MKGYEDSELAYILLLRMYSVSSTQNSRHPEGRKKKRGRPRMRRLKDEENDLWQM